ncbi:hypothetical protein VCE_000492 [Vibrio cholerae B33]|nr:hypothetical protein VCE_000492 [Vibrio cholerae B33]
MVLNNTCLKRINCRFTGLNRTYDKGNNQYQAKK